MLRRFLAMLAALAFVLFASTGAFAAVDVNTADATQLQTIKGIGPATSAKIVAERQKGGTFKDWNDLVTRVSGIGDKNSASMSAAGLTVGGASKADAPATPAAAKPSKGVGMPAPPSTMVNGTTSVPAAAPSAMTKAASAPTPAPAPAAAMTKAAPAAAVTSTDDAKKAKTSKKDATTDASATTTKAAKAAKATKADDAKDATTSSTDAKKTKRTKKSDKDDATKN
jgi:competence protein ComEA